MILKFLFKDRSMGSLRAMNLELTQANKELSQRINRIDDEYKVEISRNNELVESFKMQMEKMRSQCEEKDKEISKLSDTVRKQIEERIELSSTIDQLKNPDDNEVIMLPITSRLKAASLPVRLSKPLIGHISMLHLLKIFSAY